MATSYLLGPSPRQLPRFLFVALFFRNFALLLAPSSPLQRFRFVGSPPHLAGDIYKKTCTFVQVFIVDGNFLSSRAVSSQILSAFVSLTFVFDMGTSGSSQLLSPSWLIVLSTITTTYFLASYFAFRTKPWWSSPRPISISPLNTLLHLHSWPINLVVYKGSYYYCRDILSWSGFHA